MGKGGPIGLFDSGVGGLTVAHALHTLMPSEQLIYFGDTAHLPYGDKSKEAIVQYSIGISDFLLKQNCKLILIACNSASANAFDEVQAHVGNKAVVMNVIDPVVAFVCSETDAERTSVGIIGTKATIDSETYEKKILAGIAGTGSKLQVSSLATPLFVPMIEEGFVFDDISNAIIRSYLSRRELVAIDSLILACTHYPIIRNQISRFFNFKVNVLDTALIVAQAVQKFLSENDLLQGTQREGNGNSEGNIGNEGNGGNRANLFYVSDYTPYFEVIANMFFNEKIHLEKKNIWK